MFIWTCVLFKQPGGESQLTRWVSDLEQFDIKPNQFCRDDGTGLCRTVGWTVSLSVFLQRVFVCVFLCPGRTSVEVISVAPAGPWHQEPTAA